MISNAFLGNENYFHTFKFNPSAVSWGYSDNTRSWDTLGGRVVQLLSSKVDRIGVQGVAGSRSELQRMAKNLKDIMDYHIKTQEPVMFKVPSKEWDFLVYIESVRELGWEVKSVTYPYQINLAVIDDLTGVKSREFTSLALDRLAEGIGYNPDVHGGDAPAFADLVNSLQLAYATTGSGGVDEGEESTTLQDGSDVNVDTKGTEAIKKVYAYVYSTYPKATNMGIYVCKQIKDSTSWSQHSWGNALDIGGDSNLLNAIASDLLEKARAKTLPIAQILWQYKNLLSGGSVYNHTNHIHISGDPMFSGTPPCA